MIDRTVFGWYGFSFEHPADWGPTLISGNREEGYVRLASAGHLGCQIRWKRAGSKPDLPSRLRPYFARLERDTRKRRQSFDSESKLEHCRLLYRWSGLAQGRGALFFSEACSRVFFLEAFGRRSDSLMPAFRPIAASFKSANREEPEIWSLLGLSLRFPHGLKIERKTLLAGRTHLVLTAKGARIEADRWGFAEQLIAKHGLEGWASAALGLQSAVVAAESPGLRFDSKTRLGVPISALVNHDVGQNQLTLVKVISKLDGWRPEWEWFL